MEATQCLREEHQVILRVLDCFEIALREARESGEISGESFGAFVEFFRGFADACHHCKEEDRLFPVLERNGIPREGGPVGVMLSEHTQGRTHVRTIAEHLDVAAGGDAAATQTVLQHGQEYLALLREHIEKEDTCLFTMADQAVQGDDLAAVVEAYREVEATPEYRDRYDRCRAIADRLCETYHVAPPPSAYRGVG